MRDRRRRRRKRNGSPPTTPKVFSELIDLEKVHFKNHALDRLVQRMTTEPISDPEKIARKLLANSVEEGAISAVGRVRRLIANHFVEVRYFKNSGWRFIVKPEKDLFFVLTIERMNNKPLIPPR